MNNSEEMKNIEVLAKAEDADCGCKENSMAALPCKTSKKLCDCMKRLCSLSFEDRMDISMKISDKSKKGENGSVCFEKTLSSKTECKLMKTLGIAALVLAGVGFIGVVCSMMKK